MTIEFKLPDLGENIEAGDVVSLLVGEGDEVQAEQNVIELETDKAVVEVPCPHAGRVDKIHVKAGDRVPIGAVILTLLDSAGNGSGESSPAAVAPEADGVYDGDGRDDVEGGDDVEGAEGVAATEETPPALVTAVESPSVPSPAKLTKSHSMRPCRRFVVMARAFWRTIASRLAETVTTTGSNSPRQSLPLSSTRK